MEIPEPRVLSRRNIAFIRYQQTRIVPFGQHSARSEFGRFSWILLPKNSEILDLIGKVVYAIFRGPGLTYEYRVGIELKPFSENEGDNPPELQQKIEELEQMYGKRLEMIDIED